MACNKDKPTYPKLIEVISLVEEPQACSSSHRRIKRKINARGKNRAVIPKARREQENPPPHPGKMQVTKSNVHTFPVQVLGSPEKLLQDADDGGQRSVLREELSSQ